mgnify:CR=1 FL=1
MRLLNKKKKNKSLYPTTLKIGPYVFSISISPDICDIGSCVYDNKKILLNESCDSQTIKSTLLHEILEALNIMYELNLPHQTISILEAGIFQVLRDNNLSLLDDLK